MSDSESDTSNNVFNFQNSITTVNARGPNTNFSFRYPMTSTMHMSRNFERPRYAESAYDQRSMYSRRETSPMSIQSACDMRQRKFQQYAGMSSRHSVYNGRGGSPMSMRSIDSSASVSAADIAFAFNNGNFNRNDWKLIREAYQKVLKQRIRKRIEKRRNIRLHLKSRRRDGEDSGDQASDSSVSSDDRRSVRTYKENMSSIQSTKMDMSNFRNTFRDRNMLKESSANLCQSTFKNKFSVGSSSGNNTHNFNNTEMSNQFNAMPTQKDRFRNGFLVPSHRFNRLVASSAIMEHSGKPHNNAGNNCQSSEEEIFSTTVREKSTINIETQRKRSLDSDDESRPPNSKRSRVTSPAKNKRAQPKKNINPSNNNVELSNSFQFAKPSLPVRKSRHQVQEKLIAKSSQPLTDFLEPMPDKIQENVQFLKTTNLREKSNDNLTQIEQSDTTQNSDVSSRSSFIKRKLFTQKLDVAEKANLSTDGTNSPQSSVHTLQKEKNKARKLVTNQSCLNREVEENKDNNLLDLIHKIVPPDRINLSNQTTISQTKNDVNNKKDNDTKWDVTSVISMCNEDDASDTYTDEEIFKADNTKHTAKTKDVNTTANPINKVVTRTPLPQYNCNVMLQKLESTNTLQKQVVNQNLNITQNNITKNNVKNSGKTFWDTDFESDAECHTVLPRIHVIDNLKKANATLNNTKQDFKNPTGYSGNEISKISLQAEEVPKHLNNSLMNNTTFNDTLKLKAGPLSVRSHRTSKKKIGFNETCANATKSTLDNPGDKKKNNNSKVPAANNIGMTNSKPQNLQSKNATEISKSEPNTQDENMTTAVRLQSPKSNKKSKSKSKSEKTTVNNEKSKTEPQKNKTATKNKLEKQNERTQVKNDHKAKTQNENTQVKTITQNQNTQVKNDHKTKTQNEKTQVRNDHKAKTQNENTQVKNDHKTKTQNEKTQVKNDHKAKTHNGNTQVKNDHKTKTQNQNAQVKNDHKTKMQNENTQVKNDHKAKTQNENTQVKNDQKAKTLREKKDQKNKKHSSPNSKTKSKQPQHQNEKQSKKNKPVLKPTNSNLNNTVEPIQNTSFISGRPIRSCRTPSQNRSELNNTSIDMSKSLRSRVINLSSSIENITIKIKSKNKNSQNISIINPRISDISFSLGSGEKTPVSKMTARSRADQRKRKT